MKKEEQGPIWLEYAGDVYGRRGNWVELLGHNVPLLTKDKTDPENIVSNNCKKIIPSSSFQDTKMK